MPLTWNEDGFFTQGEDSKMVKWGRIFNVYIQQNNPRQLRVRSVDGTFLIVEHEDLEALRNLKNKIEGLVKVYG